MPPHRKHRSVWLLLVWFALSLGVAMASPVLQARSAHHDCPEMAAMADAGAMADEAVHEHEHASGGEAPASHLHHCVLCGLLGGPPVQFEFAAHQLPAAAPMPAFAVASFAFTAAPLSARGPPLP